MKFSVTIHGQERTVELRSQNPPEFFIDGVKTEAQLVQLQPGLYSIILDGKSYEVRVASAPGTESNSGEYDVAVNGVSSTALVRDLSRRVRHKAGLALEGKQDIKAPMPGKVLRVLVSENQTVQAGSGLVVVEAMKMQNEIKCPKDGKVIKVNVREGQAVNSGDSLLIVE